MTFAAGRTRILAVLACCLLLTATGGVAGISAATPSPASSHSDAEADGAFESIVRQDGGENEPDEPDEPNETVRHRNPETYDEAGDEEDLERWLSDWLSERLEDSATELSRGEYERADEYVDEEFERRLEQYVEVAGDGEGDAEDEVSAFEAARDEQRDLADALAEYNETRAAYEEAREAGDEERARELARELEALAAEIGDSSRSVRTHYDAIGEATGAALTDGTEEVEAANRTVQTEQQRIREREFVETNLTATAIESDSISFAEPLVAVGELRTAAGDPVANEDLRLNVGNRMVEVETNETGAFDLEYRPISLPADAESVSIRYVPDRGSTHLESETSVAVDVEQVEPTLSISAVDPEPIAYRDRATVDATLAVDGRSIDDVPLAVSLEGAALGVGTLDSGTVALAENETVPAAVPSGERTLAVELPFEDRALASTAAETTVTVAETEPDLSLTATRTGNRTVTVNGTLTAGDAVEGASVEVFADGTALETLPTDSDGTFGGSVSVPDDVADADADEVRISAVYDDAETNLARTETGTTVAFADGTAGPSRSTWLPLVVGAVVAALTAGAIYWYRRSRSAASAADARGDADGLGSTTDPTTASTAPVRASDRNADPTPDPDPNRVRALLERAGDRLAAGDPDDAVRSCYAAVRRTLAARLEADATGTGSFTHWEFYRRYRDAEGRTDAEAETDASSVESLRAVTEAYELAAFGEAAVSDADAETALERSRDLCSTAASADAEPLPADD